MQSNIMPKDDNNNARIVYLLFIVVSLLIKSEQIEDSLIMFIPWSSNW